MSILQHYIIVPASWITESFLEAIKTDRGYTEPHPIFDDDGLPTTYFVVKIRNIYSDYFKGFRKFTADQVEFVKAAIIDGTVITSDYYQSF